MIPGLIRTTMKIVLKFTSHVKQGKTLLSWLPILHSGGFTSRLYRNGHRWQGAVNLGVTFWGLHPQWKISPKTSKKKAVCRKFVDQRLTMIEGVDILDLDDLVFLEQIHGFFEANHGARDFISEGIGSCKLHQNHARYVLVVSNIVFVHFIYGIRIILPID